MSTAEQIKAREVVLTLLVAAGKKGIAVEDLPTLICNKVRGLRAEQARKVIDALSHGSSSGLIYKQKGRWYTRMTTPPSPVRLVNIRDLQELKTRPSRDARAPILELLERGEWVTKRQLEQATPYCTANVIKSLIDEGLMVRFGKTRSIRYSLASLKLPAPTHDPKPKKVPAIAKDKASPFTRAIEKLRQALDELESAAKAA